MTQGLKNMKREQAKKAVERRNYFRIDDTAVLHYKVITDEDTASGSHANHQIMADKLTLKARFDSISREMQPLFRVLQAASPDIARYLSSLDKKINLLSEYYVGLVMDDMDMSAQEINLGAGGIAFTARTPVMIGSLLELRLVLLPEHYGIFSYAKVVSCVRVTDNASAYKISVEFENMSDDVRDVITRHVLSKEQATISKS